MLRIALVSLGLALAGAPAFAQEPPRPRLGGTAAVDMTRPDVVEAKEFALAALKEKLDAEPEVKEITAKLQVVAGTSYMFHIVAESGAIYDITVFRSLRKELEITSFIIEPAQ